MRTSLTLVIATLLFLSTGLCHAEDAWTTLANQANIAFGVQDYALAEKLASQEMQLFEDNQEKNMSRLVYTLYTRGEIYRAENRIPQAEENYRKSYELSKTAGGYATVSPILICGRLGSTLIDDSKMDEAESVLTGCVNKTPPQSFDKNDFYARSAYINMLQNRGRFDEAESMSRDMLQSAQKNLPPDSTEISDSLNMLSLSVQKEKLGRRLEEAEAYMKQAIDICHKTAIENDLRCAMYEDNLGEQLSAQTKFDEAEKYIKSALLVRTIRLGENHAYTASTAFNLGRLYFYEGRYEEAVPILKKVMITFRATYGASSIFLEDVQHYLVESLHKLGRDQEARRVERESGMWVVH